MLFRTNLDYKAADPNLDYASQNSNVLDQSGNFKVKTLFSNVNLVEQFSPLIKVDFEMKNCIIALIDLSPINTAFEAVNLAAVDGIIGADVLKNGSAVIDYDKNYLYMK